MLVYVLQAKVKCDDDGSDEPFVILGTYSSPEKVQQAIERYEQTGDWQDFTSDCWDLDNVSTYP